jgi:hypothetical protein
MGLELLRHVFQLIFIEIVAKRLVRSGGTSSGIVSIAHLVMVGRHSFKLGFDNLMLVCPFKGEAARGLALRSLQAVV